MAGFLDLFPELRNHIYGLALTHDRSNGHAANVALLRVCKQINNEAQKMLLALTTFNIRIKSDPTDGTFHGDHNGLGVSLDLAPLIITGDISLRLEEFEADHDFSFPQVLLSVARVSIELELDSKAWEPNDINYDRASYCLLALAEFLQFARVDGGGKQEIKINLVNKRPWSGSDRYRFDRDILEVIWPMDDLREKADINLIGLGDSVEKNFLALPRSSGL